ncbi:NAD(P)/FAD-dependent oxidoreductase [Achromobacter insolitus]|jgi:sarcosine oxidase subunit beta|uniref:NAD(P)/FAD-dependent oxidoreductase n=1 Tax=Achromobacter insolitus TaxID=217204 RepID=UPI000537BBCF|nr:FAD-binding oxidoreductase [Achromobacter insolitus]AVG40563.1 FAD-binding oxidoreductase [Achromobacter insolitus]
MNPLKTEVAIIGAGLVGASAALALRRMGVATALIDSGASGARASGVNFGGVRRQGRSIEQLYLAQRAHGIWSRLPELIGTDAEYVRSGHLKLARTESDLDKLRAYRDKVSDFDLGLEIIDAAELRRRFPALGPGMAGGSLCPQDGQANPRLVAPAFAHAAARAGAHLLEHCAITQSDTQGEDFLLTAADGRRIRAATVINAAGAWGAAVARGFGDDLPLQVKYPTMLVTEPLTPQIGVSLGVEGGGFYARQVTRGNVVMGGGYGVALPGDRSRPGRAALAELGRTAPAILPALACASVIRCWSGIEGYFSDKNPVIGFSPRVPRLLHAFGFSGGGFQIAPAVGEVIAEMATGRGGLMMAEKFSVSRWDAAAQAA